MSGETTWSAAGLGLREAPCRRARRAPASITARSSGASSACGSPVSRGSTRSRVAASRQAGARARGLEVRVVDRRDLEGRVVLEQGDELEGLLRRPVDGHGTAHQSPPSSLGRPELEREGQAVERGPRRRAARAGAAARSRRPCAPGRHSRASAGRRPTPRARRRRAGSTGPRGRARRSSSVGRLEDRARRRRGGGRARRRRMARLGGHRVREARGPARRRRRGGRSGGPGVAARPALRPARDSFSTRITRFEIVVRVWSTAVPSGATASKAAAPRRSSFLWSSSRA